MRYTVRDLPSAEWTRLDSLFRAHGARLPAPDQRIIVAETEGRIVGGIVRQMVPHLEPIWIDPDHRGRLDWRRLVAAAVAELHGGTCYAFAPDAQIQRMAELCGFQRQPWRVLAKECV